MVILIYAAKRIHFGDDTYEMRVHLAVLDWVSRLPVHPPFCATLLFFTLSPVSVVNNSLSFLFLVFQYYYVRVKYILYTLCAA